jgi:hypothetical protein
MPRPRKLVTLICFCSFCGTVFPKRHERPERAEYHTYCSVLCAREGRKLRRPVVHCHHCHREFTSYPYRKKTIKYCSNACKYERNLWDRIDTSGGPDACWEWQGTRMLGYGIKMSSGKNMRVHRLVYALYNGPIPPGLIVLHLCDNPPCCNPAHLSCGTHRDNLLDAYSKGRAKGFAAGVQRRGSQNSSAKLTEEQVLEILALRHRPYGTGRKIGRELAQRFHVSPSTIEAIWAGRIWAHMTANL